MAERVLTERELNRALLARQLLLRRQRLPVVRAVERVGALQAQWPPSPYLALWSRLDAFDKAALMRAVERRRLVKTTLMRATLHLVSVADYLAYGGLIRAARTRSLLTQASRDGIVEQVETLAPRALELVSSQPRSRPELLELLGLPKLRLDDPRPWVFWHLLTARAALVHSPEGSVWRKTTGGTKFVPAASWLGGDGGGGEEAAVWLVRRYLAAFGPATRADAAKWTGLARMTLEPGFARLELRRFRDERGGELFDLPRAPLPSADVRPPVRFLPMWDSALLAHADRTRILPDAYRRTVIRPNGDVQPTFLVDGFVAGTWRVEDGRVEVEPFEPLPTRARRELEDEASRLAAFHA